MERASSGLNDKLLSNPTQEGDRMQSTIELEEGYLLRRSMLEHIQTDPHKGLTSSEVQDRLARFGYNELPENKKSPLQLLLEAFWGPMPILIWIAIVVELVVAIIKSSSGATGVDGPDEHYVDFAVLMILQFFNAFVGWHEELKAGDAVAALKKSLAPKANVMRDGKWTVIPGREVVPGDIIGLALGGAVPADCKLLEGRFISVDQAALTGESLPVKMETGDVAKMGSTIITGEIEAVAVATGANTFFGKTAALLNAADGGQSNLDQVLMNILASICALGFPCILVVIIVLAIKSHDATTVITIAVVLLVAVVPIANQVVCTSTLALGSRILSDQKAIVTRLTSIEELAGMSLLCSDKTGTLTLNKMVMQQIVTTDGKAYNFPDETSHSAEATSVLRYASLAAKWKEVPKDALDTLVLNATKNMRQELDTYDQLDYEPFNPAIKRTSATIRSPEGNTFEVCKGAPPVVLKMAHNYEDIRGPLEASINDFAERGIRVIAVAKTNKQGDWEFNGLITFLDPPRPDTKDTIEKAHVLGVSVKMITGDQLAIAKETCRVLGMGTNVHGTDVLPADDSAVSSNLVELGQLCENADGFAGVYPEHKFMIVDILQRRGHTCGMTGDGVNDAPALKKSNVGIAVQGATDAARAAADIVLTEPGLSTIITAINLSREIFQRMKNYLVYRVIMSFMLGVYFMLSVASMNPLEETGCDALVGHSKLMICQGSVTPVPQTKGCGDKAVICEHNSSDDVVDKNGIPIEKYVVLTILQLVFIILFNDGCMITVAWDNVSKSRTPKKWDMKELYIKASVLSAVVMALQYLYTWFGLAAMKPVTDDLNIFKSIFGINDSLAFSELLTMMYISISWASFFTLLSVRTDTWFLESVPGTALIAAFIFSIAITAVIGFSLKSRNISFYPCPPDFIGVTLVFNIIAFLVLDFCKYWVNSFVNQWLYGQQNIANFVRETQRQNRITLVKAEGGEAAQRRSVHRAPGSRGTAVMEEKFNLMEGLSRSVSKLTSLCKRLVEITADKEAEKLMDAVLEEQKNLRMKQANVPRLKNE